MEGGVAIRVWHESASSAPSMRRARGPACGAVAGWGWLAEARRLLGREGGPAGCRTGIRGGLLHPSTWAAHPLGKDAKGRSFCVFWPRIGGIRPSFLDDKWRKGWDWSHPATCLRLELRSHPTGISQAACGGLAEGVGFEPTVGLTQRSISSRVP